jgi:hypothetical protein
MTNFKKRRSLSDPKPFEMTCDDAQKVIKQKVEHPEQEVADFEKALFHTRFCEICKQNSGEEGTPDSALSKQIYG